MTSVGLSRHWGGWEVDTASSFSRLCHASNLGLSYTFAAARWLYECRSVSSWSWSLSGWRASSEGLRWHTRSPPYCPVCSSEECGHRAPFRNHYPSTSDAGHPGCCLGMILFLSSKLLVKVYWSRMTFWLAWWRHRWSWGMGFGRRCWFGCALAH